MSKKKKFVILVLIFGILVYVHLVYNSTVRYVFINTSTNIPCAIPRLDPFDKSVMEFYKPLPPLQCSNEPFLVYINSSAILQVNTSAVSLTGYIRVKCGYRIVERVDDYRVSLKPEVEFTAPTYVPSDYVYVICRNERGYKIYDHVFQNVDYKRVLKSKKLGEESKEQVSVILFGIDSVSRLSAERYFPLTMEFLKKELNAHVFEGYTKVGENTFPNMVSAFTGKLAFSKELPSYEQYLDNYPFLWKNFSDRGYVTYYIEDWARLSTFSLYKGFKDSPFDHYMRPYFHAIEEVEKPLFDESVHLFFENRNIKLSTESSSLCYRNLPKHQVIIDNIKRFIHVYKNKLKFSLSWINELGHEFSNFLQLADKDVKDFFKWLKDNGVLEKSVLLFYSDHGPRTAKFRNTANGRIEDFMPLMTIVTPNHWKVTHPNAIQNLSQNTERLTTPLDLYETLKDILAGEFDGHEMSGNVKQRGISFFRDIPANRTCHEASIDQTFCPCYTSKNISTKEPNVQKIGNLVVGKVNEYLKDYSHKCAKLSLLQVDSAEIQQRNTKRVENLEKFSFRKYFFKPEGEANQYLVRVQTMPGRAMYEASCSVSDNGDLSLTSDVLRINKYGNQSACIKHMLLRSYCYCV